MKKCLIGANFWYNMYYKCHFLTLLGYVMFSEYTQQLIANARRHFTSEEIRSELQLSDSDAIRLKKNLQSAIKQYSPKKLLS